MDRQSLLYGVSGVSLIWFKLILLVETTELRLGIVFRHHFIFHMVFRSVQFWDHYFLVFTMCTTPLSSVINRHQLSHHLNADNTQTDISFSTPDANSSIQQLKKILDGMFYWITESRLKLHADETIDAA